MALLQNIWWYLVLIGVMILVHEFGHYFAARFFDVKVETFSFGFGPRLFGFKRGETDFRFSLVLFGGYVEMAGDQPGDEVANDPRAFLAKPRWQRLIIAFAGPFMNIVLAVGLMTGLFMVRYPKLPTVHSPAVGYVEPGSPADKAGIKEGDRVVQVDDKTDPTWEDIEIQEVSSANRPMHVAVMRGGERTVLTLTPDMDDRNGIGRAGWSEQDTVEIARVDPTMAAAKAGLQARDLLVSVNGQPVRSKPKLHDVITQTKGAPINLEYSRNGQLHQVTVTPVVATVQGQQTMRIGVELTSQMIITQLPF